MHYDIVMKWHKEYVYQLKREISLKVCDILTQMAKGRYKRNIELNIIYFVSMADYYDWTDRNYPQAYKEQRLKDRYRVAMKTVSLMPQEITTSNIVKGRLLNDLLVLLKDTYSEDTIKLLTSNDDITIEKMVGNQEYYKKCFKELIKGKVSLYNFKKLFKDMEEHYIRVIL